MESDLKVNKWNIDIDEELELQDKHLIGIFIIIPNICPICNIGGVGLKKVENQIILIQGNVFIINVKGILIYEMVQFLKHIPKHQYLFYII